MFFYFRITSMIRFTLVFLLLITTFADLKSQSVVTRDSTVYNPRLYFSAGAYFPSVSTRLRIDGDVIGSDLSLEDDFRLLEDMSVFKVDGLVRAGQRSQFHISFTQLIRSQDFVVDEPIVINDMTFDVDAEVDLTFDTYYSALTWRYSLVNEKNWNAGFSVGMRYVYFNTSFDGRIDDDRVMFEDGIGAPAFLLGLHGGAYPFPRLLGRYSFEWIGLSVAGISINILETNASLEYFIGKNWGLGVAYSTNDYVVRDIPFSDFDGRINFEFGGGNLFLTARF